MDRKANGISRVKAELAQKQDSGGGEIFAMPTASAQKKTAQGCLVCPGEAVGFLPSAITEFVVKESIELAKRLLTGRSSKLQFGDDLIDCLVLQGRNGKVFLDCRGRIN